MRRGRLRAIAICSLLLLVALGTGGVAGDAGGPGVDSTVGAGSTTSASTNISLVQRLHLTPERPGEITVTVQYGIPAGVTDLRTRVPAGATVVSVEGFVRRSATEFAWTRESTAPRVTYRLPVNETLDVSGPIAGRGDYVFVDVGAWALVSIPPTSTGWSHRSDVRVGLSRTVTTDGPGAVGDAVAFLGQHRRVTRSAHDQTFRLIVPAAANLAASPGAILDSIASASNALRVGDRDASVFMVAAPTARVRWGVRGLQTGDSDFWVRDIESLDTADNTWIHEYVHTRQDYTTTDATRWFTEASASYYAALLTLEQGRIGFDAFRDRLAIGADSRTADAVLADPTTWQTVAPYLKGALVAGELDRQLRLATDRAGSLQTVFSRLNAHDGPVTESTFRAFVGQVGGESVAALADRYVASREVPSMWTRAEHDVAFRPAPARIGYDLPDPGDARGYVVSGPYRSGELGVKRPLRIVPGETIEFDVRVSNTGGTAGTYRAELRVNGERVASRTGTLGPGETTTVAFAHQFSEPGEYTLSVGGQRVAVSVREPATPTVADIQVRRGEQPGAVTVEATVRNDQAIPAATDLTLHQNGLAVATRRVTLAPGARTTIAFERTLEPGEHAFRIDGRTAIVTIPGANDGRGGTRHQQTKTRAPEATGRTDGFGVVLVIAALGGFALLVRRRR